MLCVRPNKILARQWGTGGPGSLRSDGLETALETVLNCVTAGQHTATVLKPHTS